MLEFYTICFVSATRCWLRSWWAATRAWSIRPRAAHPTQTAVVSDDRRLRPIISNSEFGTVAGRQLLSGVENQSVGDEGIGNDDAIIRARRVDPRLHQGNPGGIQGNRSLTR